MDKILVLTIDALAKVPGIAYCADDWGQVDRDEVDAARYPVKYPCLLVSPETSNAQIISKDAYRERMTLALRLLDAPSTSATAKAPQGQREASLAIYRLKDAICHVMAGQNYQYMGLRRLPRSDGLRELDLLFEVTIYNG